MKLGLIAIPMLVFISYNVIKKFKIILIKIQAYLLFIHLVYNVIFTPICLVKAVQDDIFAKASPI